MRSACACCSPRPLEEAIRDIADAEAAFGTIPPEVLAAARRLRWLQAPQIAPPAGFYYPELVAHPVVVTNFREIFNDHIGAHIMAFVLAFARGLPLLPAPADAPRISARDPWIPASCTCPNPPP